MRPEDEAGPRQQRTPQRYRSAGGAASVVVRWSVWLPRRRLCRLRLACGSAAENFRCGTTGGPWSATKDGILRRGWRNRGCRRWLSSRASPQRAAGAGRGCRQTDSLRARWYGTGARLAELAHHRGRGSGVTRRDLCGRRGRAAEPSECRGLPAAGRQRVVVRGVDGLVLAGEFMLPRFKSS